MSWDTSRRRETLPPDWETIRSKVLSDARGVCQIQGPGCTGHANEVDHIFGDNDHTRLQAACTACHGKKSSAQGNNRKRELKALRKRPIERHPGSR